MRFEEIINKNISHLTQTDLTILHYIMQNKKQCISLKASQLAKLTYTSSAGLTRLSKRLGFPGFSEMRFFISQEIHEGNNYKQNNFKLLEDDITQTLRLIEQTDIIPILKRIQESDRVYVYGTDWAEKHAAENLSRNFLGCNLPFIQIPSITELNWTIPFLTEKDLLILISFSGESQRVNEISTQLELKNVDTLSITPLSKNSLSTNTTFNLYYEMSKLDLSTNKQLEYNYFSSLELVCDALFRYYVDNFHSKKV
ncbi:MurR/RpiR family transcriptional regulator [Pediococcus parvulus]|uniref:MurR/RpiR family transcriptional regulator n=1 Tax=Pediococcus parvulus TaxID=54062 RepID=UPI00345EF31F